MSSPPVDDLCCVCHERFNLPCQANCSHWFCGNCIMRVWSSGFTLQPCKCPLCRRLITLLLPGASLYQSYDREAYRVLRNIENYNRQFGSGSNGLIQSLRDVPFFLRRLLREWMDPQRALPLAFRARTVLSMLFSVIYVLSPFDILPERIFGFVGFLDDLLVLVIVFLNLAAVYRALLLNRHGGA
ncbi:unnamed protein product [Musa acuminata subsp. malaccensis]|uniref:E3 ubiquitin-protein ligase RNF170 n=1 Tax=Musa acuminata subsp. malaccensis TaxID=214687 RepID=A0A804K451_MUSAM|nr:PREDICTED: E3 ubiquitin-protein ligase RNF170-like [Musa acuminata subsp. malaccensis]CAG1830900.1 unnamed protein product [Musa acuminata subsp. malaccensis]